MAEEASKDQVDLGSVVPQTPMVPAPYTPMMPAPSTPGLTAGVAAPQTPPREASELTLRSGAKVAQQEQVEPDAKRARVEDPKKQRIHRLPREYEEKIKMVKMEYGEYFTMDEYETDLDMTNEDDENDLWHGEDEVQLPNSPEAVWSNCDVKTVPALPGEEVEEVADMIEIKRLLDMGVLVRAEDGGPISGGCTKLTTKFVRDWRLKDYTDQDGKTYKRWMRRSRYVAREFAREKRLDTFSPATGAHVANLLQLAYLHASSCALESQGADYKVALGTMDVKDAFLMVKQESPIQVKLQGQHYIIERNLPGQRLGAKAWYLHLRKFLSDSMQFTWCVEQPCLCKE